MKTPFIRRWSGCTVGLLFSILFSASAFAQFEKGAIGGTVTDSSGALMVGAEVKATSVNTGVVRSTVTNDAGIFTLTELADMASESVIRGVIFSHPCPRFVADGGDSASKVAAFDRALSVRS